MSSATNTLRFVLRVCSVCVGDVVLSSSSFLSSSVVVVVALACALSFVASRVSFAWCALILPGLHERGVRLRPAACYQGILAEGAIALPVTLSGGVLFAS